MLHKAVAGWFVGAHTMEKAQQAALVFPTNGGHKETGKDETESHTKNGK